MTYWSLNAVFLGGVALVAIGAVLGRRGPRWRAIGLAAIPLPILTAVFDNVLVATGIVGYAPDRISGIRLGVAPLEDFAYAVAAVVLGVVLGRTLGPIQAMRRAA